MTDSDLITVIVPQVGEGAADVVLSRWVKQLGDQVIEGEELFEVDTEKATVTVEAFASGTLEAILAPEGTTVTPLQPIATIRRATKA
ncbi:hypothetical protein BH20CHL7_BH20CHL7_03730 [soil metagenome]